MCWNAVRNHLLVGTIGRIEILHFEGTLDGEKPIIIRLDPLITENEIISAICITEERILTSRFYACSYTFSGGRLLAFSLCRFDAVSMAF